MAIYKNGQEQKALFYKGKKVLSAYKNGQKIYDQEEPRYLLCSDGSQYIAVDVFFHFNRGTSLSMDMSAAMFANPNGGAIQANGISYMYNIFIGVNSEGRYVYNGRTTGEDVLADGMLHTFHLESFPIEQTGGTSEIDIPIVLNEIDWKFEIDGHEVDYYSSFQGPSVTNAFFIFAVGNQYMPQNFITQKLEYFKLTHQGILLMDLWPVPEGKTLYGATSPAPSNCLYCKVQKKYFQNYGTRNLTIERI